MSDDEFLMTTRKRRANAGARLKQLIDMEQDTATAPSVSRFVNEDDENVNLLFQEDGEDEEFVESESSDEEEGDEEEGEEEEAQEKIEENGEEDDDDEQSDVAVNSDEQLSDSDISMSDSDEDEGERELENQEKQKKRKQKRQSRLIPKIKRFKAEDGKPKKSTPKKIINSETLLHNMRRASSRASAIENKEALVQKLKEDEERRAKLTPVFREKEREITQEEKLAEAVETEIANVRSLELFQQQEVVKKERQKLLLHLRRAKMVDILRFESKEEIITPNDEVDNARKYFDALTSKSRKKTSKKWRTFLDFALARYPGGIDKELPYVKAQEAEKAKEEAAKEEAAKEEAAKEAAKDTDKDGEKVDGEKAAEPVKQVETDAVQALEDGHETQENPDETKDAEDKSEKHVTFVDDDKDEEVAEDTEGQDPAAAPEQEIFQGPVQRICRDTIYLLEFDPKSLDETRIKQVVLGDDAILPASRRFKELKTIVRIGRSNNPYAKVREEKDEIFLPANDLTEDNPMFEELNRLPKLGIRQAIVEEVVEEDKNDGEIVLNTEAPLGLYLPNGNKKLCLITGQEVKYFDPSLGVPYSDVETFKFLKSVEQGNIPWYSFDSTYNDTGSTELYLGSKDGSFRHARGVPEGFE